jgi:GNAT superfamily N-acetyltransferase
MNTLQLRRYKPGDEIAVVDLWHRSWAAAFPNRDHPLPFEKWMDRFMNEIVVKDQVWIAQHDIEIVGFLALDRVAAYVDQIFVDPNAQSKSVGAALLKKAKNLCPNGLTLHALRENDAALRFYEHQEIKAGTRGTNPVNGLPTIEFTWRPSNTLREM